MPLAEKPQYILVNELERYSAFPATESTVFSEVFFRASDAYRIAAFGTGSRGKVFRRLRAEFE